MAYHTGSPACTFARCRPGACFFAYVCRPGVVHPDMEVAGIAGRDGLDDFASMATLAASRASAMSRSIRRRRRYSLPGGPRPKPKAKTALASWDNLL